MRSLPARVGELALFEHIGRGGMADIYLARQAGSDRLLAVKEVLPLPRRRMRFTELLVREARLSLLVRHPRVVQVHQLVMAGREPLMVMEYVEGIDLRELLKSCSRRRIPLPIRCGMAIVCAVLEGLDAVHRADDENGLPLGMVHRDVSPANVLLSFDGDVKLCDFGIAVAMTEQDAPPQIIEGKAGYMSPEQARGGGFDARSDVYSAGIMLWELLAGRRMARARGDADPLAGAVRGVVPALIVRGLPQEARLHGIVRKALARTPGERYQSAAIMRRELEAYCQEHAMLADGQELADWLHTSFPGRVAQRKRWASLTGIEPDEPTQSGIRRVRRPELAVFDEPDEDATLSRRFTQHALLTCVATFAALCLLGWLGIL